MKRLALILAVLGAGLSLHAADAPVPAVAPPSPQKVADHVIAVFKSHRAAALKKESAADIAIMEKGAKDFPKETRIYLALAYCYIVQDDKAAHLKNIEKAHELSQDDAQIELSYSVALKLNKQPAKALEVMKVLAAKFPKIVPVQYQMAVMEMALQKYDEAIAIIEPILQDTATPAQDPDKAMYLCSLAECYLYKGDRQKAIDLGNQALAAVPGFREAFVVLGESYLKNGDVENAATALSQAVTAYPGSARAHYFQGLLQEKQGKGDEAKASFAQSYDILKSTMAYNEEGEDYFQMYLVCGKLGKKDEAEKYKAEAVKLGFAFEAPWKK